MAKKHDLIPAADQALPPPSREAAAMAPMGPAYLVLFTVAVGVAVATAWWFWPGASASAGEGDEALLRRFAGLVRAADRRALDLLPPPEPWPQEPVTEAESERLAASHFLRLPELRIVEVLPGEPDGNGKQKPVQGRWTLGTKAASGTPPHIVQPDTKPMSVTRMNPDLVVEVRDGKIIAVRTELCLR